MSDGHIEHIATPHKLSIGQDFNPRSNSSGSLRVRACCDICTVNQLHYIAIRTDVNMQKSRRPIKWRQLKLHLIHFVVALIRQPKILWLRGSPIESYNHTRIFTSKNIKSTFSVLSIKYKL